MSGTSEKIDLFRGWPNSSLLPVTQLREASNVALQIPSVYEIGLQYGPDEGYEPLRRHIAEWLTNYYKPPIDISPQRICITGGASQNLACLLQVFTDPIYTRNVWMIAPTYFLACRIMDDSGFAGRLRGVPEDDEGVDLVFLRRELEAAEVKAAAEGNFRVVCIYFLSLVAFIRSFISYVFSSMTGERRECRNTNLRDRGERFTNTSSTQLPRFQILRPKSCL